MPPTKKKRGRPKGSGDKVAKEVGPAKKKQTVSKGRGRPKGSRNKTPEEKAEDEEKVRGKKEPKVTTGQKDEYAGAPAADALKDASTTSYKDDPAYPTALTERTINSARHTQEDLVSDTKDDDEVESKEEKDDKPKPKPVAILRGVYVPVADIGEKYGFLVDFPEKKFEHQIDVLPYKGPIKSRMKGIHIQLLEDMETHRDKFLGDDVYVSFMSLLDIAWEARHIIHAEVMSGKASTKGSHSLGVMVWIYIHHHLDPKHFQWPKPKTVIHGMKSIWAMLWTAAMTKLVKASKADKADIGWDLQQAKDNKPDDEVWKARKWRQPWVDWMNNMDRLVPYVYPNPGTEATGFRKPSIKDPVKVFFDPKKQGKARALFEHHEDRRDAASYRSFDYKFGISNERADMRKASAQRTKLYQNLNPFVFMDDTILTAYRTMMASNDYIDKILLVELITGARFIEVIRISEFHDPMVVFTDSERVLTQDDPRYWRPGDVIQYRVAKDRKGVVTKVNEDTGEETIDEDVDLKDYKLIDDRKVSMRVVGPKPVLFDGTAGLVRYLVYKIIRPEVTMRIEKAIKGDPSKTIKNMGNTEYGRFFQGKCNIRLRELLKRPLKERGVGTHTFRKIYANMSFDRYADKRMSRNAWIMNVLGHQPGAIETSISYTGIVINHALKRAEPTWTQRQEDIETELKVLSAEFGDFSQKVMSAVTEERKNDFYIKGHRFVRAPRTRSGDQKRLDLIHEKVQKLMEYKIYPANQTIRLFGFSAEIVNKYKATPRGGKKIADAPFEWI